MTFKSEFHLPHQVNSLKFKRIEDPRIGQLSSPQQSLLVGDRTSN